MAYEKVSERWWGRVVLGIIAIIVGLAFLVVPGISLVVFLVIFGAFMILTGLVLLSYAWSRPAGTKHRGLNFLEGAIDIVIRRHRACGAWIDLLVGRIPGGGFRDTVGLPSDR